jgi:hypothetical protein
VTALCFYSVAELEHSENNERWISVGYATNGSILSVVYLLCDADPTVTKIRLIIPSHAKVFMPFSIERSV